MNIFTEFLRKVKKTIYDNNINTPQDKEHVYRHVKLPIVDKHGYNDKSKDKRVSSKELPLLYILLYFSCLLSIFVFPTVVSKENKLRGFAQFQLPFPNVPQANFQADDPSSQDSFCSGVIQSLSQIPTEGVQILVANLIGSVGSSQCFEASGFVGGINETITITTIESRFVYKFGDERTCMDPTNDYSCPQDSSGRGNKCGDCHCDFSPASWGVSDCQNNYYLPPYTNLIQPPDVDVNVTTTPYNYCFKTMLPTISTGCPIVGSSDYQVKFLTEFKPYQILDIKRDGDPQMKYEISCNLDGVIKSKKVTLVDDFEIDLTDICVVYKKITLLNDKIPNPLSDDYILTSSDGKLTSPENIYLIKREDVNKPGETEIEKPCFATSSNGVFTTNFANLNQALQSMQNLHKCYDFDPKIFLSLPRLFNMFEPKNVLHRHLSFSNAVLDLSNKLLFVTSPFKNQVKIEATINAVLSHVVQTCDATLTNLHCETSINESPSPCTMTVNIPNRCQFNLYDFNTGDLISDFVGNAGSNVYSFYLKPSFQRNGFYKVCIGNSVSNSSQSCSQAEFKNQIDTSIIDGPNATKDPIVRDPVTNNNFKMGNYGTIFLIIIIVVGSLAIIVIAYKFYCILKGRKMKKEEDKKTVLIVDEPKPSRRRIEY